MKIEILMATYNGEKYIKEQIDSIVSQSYYNWKLLIRDDGSKDNTINIIKEYEKKDKRINITISSRDLVVLQRRALAEGMPYQTFLSSILHKYASGTLQDIIAANK